MLILHVCALLLLCLCCCWWSRRWYSCCVRVCVRLFAGLRWLFVSARVWLRARMRALRARLRVVRGCALCALCAFYECRTWFGREFDKNLYPAGMSPQEYAFKEMLGFPTLDWDKTPQPPDLFSPAGLNDYYKRTGGL